MNKSYYFTLVNVSLALCLVVVFSFMIGQVQHAFHGHDDWQMLLDDAPARYIPFIVGEGRWGNYLWFYFTPHLTANTSFLLFAITYALVVCVMIQDVSSRTLFILSFAALFFSPFAGESAQFSATLFPAFFVLLLSCLALRISSDWKGDVAIALGGQAIGFLTHPLISPVILIYLLYLRSGDKLSRLVVFVSTLFVAAVVAALIIALLNLFFFGRAGVEIGEWRCPNPGTSLSALKENLSRFIDNSAIFAGRYWPLTILGSVSVALGLANKGTRRQTAALLFGFAACLAFELAVTLYTGATLPPRGRHWPWVGVCLICSFGVREARPTLTKLLFGGLLICLAGTGMYGWVAAFNAGQRVTAYLDRLIEEASHADQNRLLEWYTFGDSVLLPEDLDNGHIPFTSAQGFRDYAKLRYELDIQECDDTTCAGIPPSDANPIVKTADTIVFKFHKSEAAAPTRADCLDP